MFGYIPRAQHDAAIAAKDAEIARERANAKHWFETWHAADQACAAHEHRLSDLEGQLAKTYIRDDKGRIARHPTARALS